MFGVVAADLPVPIMTAKFYAAIDIGDGLCWVDDVFYAQRFDTTTDAEDFARTRVGLDGWKVVPL